MAKPRPIHIVITPAVAAKPAKARAAKPKTFASTKSSGGNNFFAGALVLGGLIIVAALIASSSSGPRQFASNPPAATAVRQQGPAIEVGGRLPSAEIRTAAAAQGLRVKKGFPGDGTCPIGATRCDNHWVKN